MEKIDIRMNVESLECDCACGEMESKQVIVRTEEVDDEQISFFTSEIVFQN